MNTIIIKKRHLLPCFLFISFCSHPATSAPRNSDASNWYIGGSIGKSNLKPDGGNTWNITENSDLGTKVYLGKDIAPEIGLEAFWADFGEAELANTSGSTGKVNYKAIGANVVYNAPLKIGGVRPLAKLGVAKFSNKDKGAVHSNQLNNLTIFGGLGVEYDISNSLSLRSEFEYFDEDVNQLSIGLNWRPSFGNKPQVQQEVFEPVAPPPPAEKITEIVPVYVPKPEIIPVYMPPAQPAPVAAPPPAPVVPAPAPAPKEPQYRTVHKALSGGSYFASGSAQLTYNGKNALDQLSSNLQNQKMSIRSIQIDGHTDSIGSNQKNQTLSYNRARSVADYLTSRGVSQQLIRIQGFGETQPIANNNTKQGRSKNRRVEIRIKGTSKEVVQ